MLNRQGNETNSAHSPNAQQDYNGICGDSGAAASSASINVENGQNGVRLTASVAPEASVAMEGNAATDQTMLSTTRQQRDVKPSLSKIDFGEFYPEGGWGWVICVAVALVYIFCSGFHFSYGSLYIVICTEFNTNSSSNSDAVWLGSLGLSVNMLLSPVVSTVCRRKSPRLYAVVGGLITSLGCLFLAFSTQMEHFFISYGVVFSIGSGITCHTAAIMIGRYFKQRRDAAEVFVIVPTGLGIIVMSVIINKSHMSLGWMHGLQCLSGILTITIFCGAFYRSVTLFHPRRKVILHIRNKKKSRIERGVTKPHYFDFSALRMRSIQCLMLISAVVAVGLYVPILLLMQSAVHETSNKDQLLLLNVYLGLGFTVGALAHAFVIIRKNKKCVISRRYLCQSTTLCCGVISLMVTMARDYNAFGIFACLYGICVGGYQYSLKSYTYELVNSRVMERAWGFVTAAQCLSVLVGTPFAAYLNGASTSRPGYLFAGVFPLLGSMLFFTMSKAEKHPSNSEIIEKQESSAEYTVVETAALIDVNLSDFVTTKPMGNHILLSSGEHIRGASDPSNVYQLQSIISPKDSKQLAKISEDPEADMSRVTGMSAVSDYLMTRTRSGRMERDSSNGTSLDHSHDLFTSSSSSSNDRKTGHNGRKGDRVVKVELVDPPSQEKESTATVSYDSDLYINLCEALV